MEITHCVAAVTLVIGLVGLGLTAMYQILVGPPEIIVGPGHAYCSTVINRDCSEYLQHVCGCGMQRFRDSVAGINTISRNFSSSDILLTLLAPPIAVRYFGKQLWQPSHLKGI